MLDLAIKRNELREKHIKELEGKGKFRTKKTSTRKGYTGASSSSNSYSSSSSIVAFGSSGINSTIVQNAYINNQIYLKPTKIGVDGFFSVGRCPIDNWYGEFNIVTYCEVRYSTSTVYDVDSFESAWESAQREFSVGSADNWTVGYNSSIGGIGGYLHLSPTLSNNYSYQQLVKVHLVNNINNELGFSGKVTVTSYSQQLSISTLSTPTVSFNQTTNLFTLSNYASNTSKVVEFNRSNYTPYSSYLSSVETDICYNCSVRNQEWGLYYGQAQGYNFAIWNIGTYKVKLVFDVSHPNDTRQRFSDAVNNWISRMNTAINGSGISFVRDDNAETSDVYVVTKSNSAMGSNANYIYAGLWSNLIDENGWIYFAEIKLNYETQYYDDLASTVEHITTEELFQACGCGGDLTTRADCINTDFNYKNKNPYGQLNTIDSHIANFLYNSDIYVCVGGDCEELAVKMNPSNGFTYTFSNLCNAYWMKENTTYNLRTWQVDYNNMYSVVPSYVSTFTPINYPQVPSSPYLDYNTGEMMTVKWDNSLNSDYYHFAYSLNQEDWNYIDNVATNSVDVWSIETGVTYYFSVRGKSLYNKPPSAWSAIGSGYIEGRPSNFSWGYTVESGGSDGIVMDYTNKKIKIMTSSKWNSFTAKVNQFRQYKGLSTIGFTVVSSGNPLLASVYNQVRNAINDMSIYFTGGKTCPPTITTGSKITAEQFTQLSDALNSVQ